MNVNVIRTGLLGISAYRDVMETPVMRQAIRFLDALVAGQGEQGVEAYCQLFYQLRMEGCLGLGQWLGEALRWSEGPYSMLCQRGERDPALETAAERDVRTFELLAAVDCDDWVARLNRLLGSEYQGVLTSLPRWHSGIPFSFAQLTQSYQEEGAGIFARHRAFVWEDGTLIPVLQPDCPTSDELLGYNREREEVAANTRLLCQGRRVNNVLLYGESGTGKSATVKNLLTLPGMEELRIIEADKEHLSGLPSLIRTLRGRRQKFIVFIDDLTFDRDDPTYAVLKTILEGGLERRPDNVAVYATSNRRHLVRQTISEREGDEMDRDETIREKTSLADRFGLRVLFQGMGKKAYLDLVDLLAHRQGIQLNREELHRGAITWERFRGGQTPRTALQYILSLG